MDGREGVLHVLWTSLVVDRNRETELHGRRVPDCRRITTVLILHVSSIYILVVLILPGFIGIATWKLPGLIVEILEGNIVIEAFPVLR